MEMEKQRRRQGCRWMLGVLFAVGVGMLLSLLPGDGRIKKASADMLYFHGDWRYELDEDENAILTDYYGNESEIVVDEKIDGHTIVGLVGTFLDTNVRKVTLPDTVTNIGDRAFYSCNLLSEISMPDGVTSLGDYVFCGCSSLSEISIPDGVTSIGERAFWQCSSLSKMQLSPGLIRIGDSAFEDCTSLSEIEFPAALKTIGKNAFERCGSLCSIKFPEGLQSIDECAFSMCNSLTDVLLPAGLKKISSKAFYNCDNLVAIQLDDRNQDFCLSQGILYNRDQTEVIMVCDRMMQAANISEGVKKISGYAFYSCDHLSSVDFPDTLKYIGDGAFEQCGSLQQLVIPKNVTEIGKEILYNCCALKQLKILGPLKELNGICSQCPVLEQVSLPDGLRVISGFSFDYCHNLKQINLPESVEVIEEYAFGGAGITSLLIPPRVTQIEERALAAPDLKSITVAEGNSHFYMRSGCLYNDAHTLLVCIAASDKVDILPGCIRIGKAAFYDRSGICEVEIPDTVKEIGEEAFTGCRKLTEVYMGNQLQAIGRYAFQDTPFLSEQAEVENGVEYLGPYAISRREESAGEVLRIREGCTLIADGFSIINYTLKYLWLSDSLQYIGKDAFGSCFSLQEIIGGRSLVSIGEKAFMYCNLERVLIRGEKVSIGTDAFDFCVHHFSEFMVDAEEVVLSEHCFGGSAERQGGTPASTLVLPNLNIPFRKTGLTYQSLNETKLVLTNMPAGVLSQEETLFADCEGLQLYLPYSEDAFTTGDSLSEQGVSVSYQNEWHLCRFMIHGLMKKLDILPDGAVVIPFIAEEGQYLLTPKGPLLTDIEWDLDGDGSADELPEIIHTDIKAEALYNIQELEHCWWVKEVLQELTCTQDGDVLYYCTGCGEEKRVQTKAKGHVFSKEWTIDQDASCTEPGEKSHHCTGRGCTERDSITAILQTGHNWDAGVITKDPQIGVEGEKVFTCIVCGEQKKETVDALLEPTGTPMPSESDNPAISELLPTPGSVVVPEQSMMPYTSVALATQKVLGLRIKASYRKISLSWAVGNKNIQYWIYRSDKKNGRKKLLKKLPGSQSRYSDKRVTTERVYYYQIRAMRNDQGNMKSCGSSRICKAMLKLRKAPMVQLRKRRQGQIRYLEITLRKYTGNRLEIYYRKRKKGAYRPLKLRTNVISKNSKFKIKYLSSHGKLFFRFRTYRKQGKIRIYSRYTAEEKINLAK